MCKYTSLCLILKSWSIYLDALCIVIEYALPGLLEVITVYFWSNLHNLQVLYSFVFLPGWVTYYKEATAWGIFSWRFISSRSSLVHGDTTTVFTSCPNGVSGFWRGKNCWDYVTILWLEIMVPIFLIFVSFLFQIIPAAVLTDDDTLTEINGSQSDRKTSLSVNTLDILSVNELMESVRGANFMLFWTKFFHICRLMEG